MCSAPCIVNSDPIVESLSALLVVLIRAGHKKTTFLSFPVLGVEKVLVQRFLRLSSLEDLFMIGAIDAESRGTI